MILFALLTTILLPQNLLAMEHNWQVEFDRAIEEDLVSGDWTRTKAILTGHAEDVNPTAALLLIARESTDIDLLMHVLGNPLIDPSIDGPAALNHMIFKEDYEGFALLFADAHVRAALDLPGLLMRAVEAWGIDLRIIRDLLKDADLDPRVDLMEALSFAMESNSDDLIDLFVRNGRVTVGLLYDPSEYSGRMIQGIPREILDACIAGDLATFKRTDLVLNPRQLDMLIARAHSHPAIVSRLKGMMVPIIGADDLNWHEFIYFAQTMVGNGASCHVLQYLAVIYRLLHASPFAMLPGELVKDIVSRSLPSFPRLMLM